MHNWRKILPGTGIELFCGDAGGGEPDDRHPCVFGMMPAGSAEEATCAQEYATGSALADHLARLKRNPYVQELAKEFCAVLKEWLKPEELAQIAEDNHRYQQAAGQAASGICATHDYCDSNEAMAEAFGRLGCFFDVQDEDQCRLFEEAWDIAKKADFKL